jgi:hypothetical protein
VELAISGVEEKLTIRKGSLSFVGLARRLRWAFVVLGNPSMDPHLSKGDIPSCKWREHGNTSSSLCASVISIPEFTFLCDSHRAWSTYYIFLSLVVHIYILCLSCLALIVVIVLSWA